LVVVNFPPDAAVPEAAVPDAAAPAAVEAAAALCTLCCALEVPHPVRVMVITAAAVIMDSTFDELLKPFLCILFIIFPPLPLRFLSAHDRCLRPSADSRVNCRFTLSSAVRSGHGAGPALYIKKRQGSLRLPYRLFTDMKLDHPTMRSVCGK
jgi:hypothetical protein